MSFPHAHAAVEIRNGADDDLALAPCVREPGSLLKFRIGNIHNGFPDATACAATPIPVSSRETGGFSKQLLGSLRLFRVLP